MTNVHQPCEIATRLSVIESRLREKAKTAATELTNGAYALGACEIQREAQDHHRQCDACKASENLEVAA